MAQEALAGAPKAQASMKVGIGEKLGFMAFSGSNNIVYQFKSIYYLFFLTEVAKVGMYWAGVIMTIGAIWDAVNDPLIGFWAVNRRFKNGDAARPFALWHSVPWAVTVVLLFSDFQLSTTLTIVIATLVYILFEVFNTTVGIPYNSMGGLATNIDSERRSINVFRNLGGCIGSGVGALACLPLLKLFGALDSSGNLADATSRRGFVIVAMIMGSLIILGGFIHYFTSKERVSSQSGTWEKVKAVEIAKMLFKTRSWRLNMIYIICYGLTNLLLMSCVAYYATYVLGSTGAAINIQAAYLVASIVSSFFVNALDAAIGRRMSMVFAAAIAILGKIWFIIAPSQLGAIYVNAITVGISVTFAFVLFNTNRNNIVDIIEHRDGKRIDSMIATSDNLVSKLAVAFGTFLITFSLGNAGYDANQAQQPAAVISAINFMLGWAPLIASAVMVVAAFRLPIEDDLRKVTEARKERQN
ncbi:MAG: glycoside-pentoside-hexuronide (GPH):cation symporter [Clostridiales bacterium]|jgi:sugar (glycoside-pentoside-hexuronide) transporter|nr:glycoside-pentoside-hexuronide (GPH):cation symporter [Clostridiales bacterium]